MQVSPAHRRPIGCESASQLHLQVFSRQNDAEEAPGPLEGPLLVPRGLTLSGLSNDAPRVTKQQTPHLAKPC